MPPLIFAAIFTLSFLLLLRCHAAMSFFAADAAATPFRYCCFRRFHYAATDAAFRRRRYAVSLQMAPPYFAFDYADFAMPRYSHYAYASTYATIIRHGSFAIYYYAYQLCCYCC